MLCASIPFDDESFRRIFECHGKQLIITPVSKMTFFSTNIGSFLSFLLSLLQEVEVSSLHLSLSEFHAPFSSLFLCLYLLIFFIFSPDQISLITAICVLITVKKNINLKKKRRQKLTPTPYVSHALGGSALAGLICTKIYRHNTIPSVCGVSHLPHYYHAARLIWAQ